MFGPENETIHKSFMQRLQTDFRIVTGPATWFLKIGIKQNADGSLCMSQERYTLDILKRFNMSDANAVGSPISMGANTAPVDPEVPRFDARTYRGAIGALLHLSKWTRGDIAYSVSFCARSMQKPTGSDWQNVKRIFRYLKGTVARSLNYTPEESPRLVGYSDSDYANCPTSRKSVGGYIFLIGNHPISWNSTKQNIVATSVMEAEYIAAHSASQEAVFLSKVILDFLGNLSFRVVSG